MRPHLPEEEIHAYLDGELSPPQRIEIAEHLMACLICRAQHAEVAALRDRTSALLTLAAPRVAPRKVRVGQPRLELRRGVIAASVAAMLAVGVWSTITSAGTPSSAPRLSTAFVAPAILAGIDAISDVVSRADLDARTRALAARAALRPRVVSPDRIPVVLAASQSLRVIDPLIGSDHSPGWEVTTLQAAQEASEGMVAHLQGIPVNAVKLHRVEQGGRPTAMVRQVLPDGRALWVVEGAQDDVDPVFRMLEASGLSLSTPARSRPDYLGPDEAPVRTIRVVAVAGYLAVDSLEVLARSLQ